MPHPNPFRYFKTSADVTALIEGRGWPGMPVSDNGTELTSNAILRWCSEHRIEWHYIAPGKPMQNGFVESFNGGCATSCFCNRDVAVKLRSLGLPSGVMLLSAVGTLARRIMVVEGEADHAKRRACGFARICSPGTRAVFASSPSLTGTGRDPVT